MFVSVRLPLSASFKLYSTLRALFRCVTAFPQDYVVAISSNYDSLEISDQAVGQNGHM